MESDSHASSSPNLKMLHELRRSSVMSKELDYVAEVRLRLILQCLSNRDSFEIFRLATRGIDATMDVMKDHGFSRKRYYTRLRELLVLGLVEKHDRKYTHTELGRLVYSGILKVLERPELIQEELEKS